jgi:hypothetical protein
VVSPVRIRTSPSKGFGCESGESCGVDGGGSAPVSEFDDSPFVPYSAEETPALLHPNEQVEIAALAQLVPR